MNRSKTLFILLFVLNAAAPAAAWLLISSPFMIAPYPYQNFSGPVSERIPLKDPGRFRLAILSDLHNNTAGFKIVMGFVDKIGADAALILGDFTHRGLIVEKRLFINQVRRDRWPIALYTLVGNHDLDFGRETANDYRALFGDDHYWWRFGDCLFIVVNNVERAVREDQYAWMVETAKKEGRPGGPIYLFMHKPPFEPDRDVIVWEKRFKKYVGAVAERGLNTIFCGHLHHYEEHEIGGVKIIVAGNIGDFDDKGAAIPLQYLTLDCGPDACTVARRELGTYPGHTTLAHRLLVDYYWGWLVWAGVSAALLAAVLLRRRTRVEADPINKSI